jgi:CXXC-20-CXXC protein
MSGTANNQCPNCGHRFSDREMLFWGLSKTSHCPDCGSELGVNRDRMLILWIVGIVGVMFIESYFSLHTPRGWIAIAIFVLLFGLVAVRLQKLEIKK